MAVLGNRDLQVNELEALLTHVWSQPVQGGYDLVWFDEADRLMLQLALKPHLRLAEIFPGLLVWSKGK